MASLWFGLLGPLEVLRDGEQVALPSAKQRIVLTALLLRANQVVTVDELIDRLWPDEVPSSPRPTAQAYVMRLRRVLGDPAEDYRLVRTVENGYLIDVAPGQLDLTLFREEMRLADEAAGRADPAQETVHLRAALALWRGKPLANVPSDQIRREEVPWLEELRLQALERRMRLELDSGGHDQVITELRALTTEYPLRERFWAQLMLALHRADRQADALEAHRGLTKILADELGIDPGDEVQRLQLAILNNDPALRLAVAAPVAAPRPASALPPDSVDFVGRATEIAAVTRLLDPAATARAPRYVVLSGPPGVGKTALAIHLAHLLDGAFPDGCLYVNLRGYSQQAPLGVPRALTQLLRGLGVRPEQIPLDEEDQLELYGSLLAGKRMLVVLDNAAGSGQVRPLLPTQPGCAAVVTSRNDLRGLVALQGARRVALDPLPDADARLLLADIVGPGLVAAEPDAAAELVRLCARLPLAVRIAGANLSSRSATTIADYVTELRQANRLSALAIEDDEQAAVRTAFGLSYEMLKPEVRHLFRVLGHVPGPDFTPAAAAALSGESVEQATRLLGTLVTASLVQPQARNRYQFHDLLRLYAQERAELEDSPEFREAALRRLYSCYLGHTDAAARVLDPALPRTAPTEEVARFEGPQEALGWLNEERVNLVAAVEFAAGEESLRPLSWQLTDGLTGYLHTHRHDSDLLASGTTALAAAREHGDQAAEATMLGALGVLRWSVGDYVGALDHLRRSLALHRAGDNPAAVGTALVKLGVVHLEDGTLSEAVRHLTEALGRSTPAGGVVARVRLGAVHLEMGELATARAHLDAALAECGPLGLVHTEALALNTLGAVHLRLGEFDDAITCHESALARYRTLGSRHDQAEVLQNLAAVYRDARRYERAVEYGEMALELARDTGNLRFEVDTLNTTATARRGLGRHDPALDAHAAALTLAVRSGYRQGEIAALIGMAATRLDLGLAGEAAEDAWRAAELARSTRFRLREAQALTVLAAAELAVGRHAAAGEHGRQALRMHADAGNALGQAGAHRVLGLLATALGDREDAERHLTESLRLHERLATGAARAIQALLDEL
ncbi:BTAD domain-containing putative transcriptional regulator [Actinokineospora sp. NBRC 105648]|uniref:AfsR/SARP family transcriptional regulator n=1 Tax=Actinokineospora sp. NBRC 105648 TaxID=3032206 RepID=UPI0024A051E5|nr:BTAD domain-containing putative transcriptional regulator [Actinokineospora sp. NBRC 105648]GLZ40442.1 SARP family transcriptional regulator [Actinokineospora sp. NBRC 105648]